MKQTPPTPAAPTIQQIRQAIIVIQIGVRDPHADPVDIAAAHRLLVKARTIANPPVQEWLSDYLNEHTTTDGAQAFRVAVDTLAQHFKLPPASPPPAPGEQGRLFT